MWGEDASNVAVSSIPTQNRLTVMVSPMTLYHSLSPIPNTLYRCIRLYQESMCMVWEGKLAISRTEEHLEIFLKRY